MDSTGGEATSVIATLRDRLRALAGERDLLALRARELEAELAATSAAAQRRAAEAVQLEALISFYEQESPPGPTSRLPGPTEGTGAAAPAATATPVPIPAAIRRASGSWTSAWREAAVATLTEHGAPMHYRELYRAVAARGFTFGGQRPEATFLASLHRDRATFQGAGKGTYWLVGQGTGAVPATAPRTRRRMRRPRPIGKPKGGV
jgi:hypothetical protein